MGIEVSGSLGGTIDKIKRLMEIEELKKEFCEKLADIGVEVASVGFAGAAYDGVNDVVVNTPHWEGDNLIVSASGSSVLFIEFGSGVFNPPYPKAVEGISARGTYGHGLGRFESWRYWGDPGTNGVIIQSGEYKGMVETKGNPPACAMYNASMDMREAIEDIATEVFKK